MTHLIFLHLGTDPIYLGTFVEFFQKEIVKDSTLIAKILGVKYKSDTDQVHYLLFSRGIEAMVSRSDEVTDTVYLYGIFLGNGNNHEVRRNWMSKASTKTEVPSIEFPKSIDLCHPLSFQLETLEERVNVIANKYRETRENPFIDFPKTLKMDRITKSLVEFAQKNITFTKLHLLVYDRHDKESMENIAYYRAFLQRLHYIFPKYVWKEIEFSEIFEDNVHGNDLFTTLLPSSHIFIVDGTVWKNVYAGKFDASAIYAQIFLI